MNIENNSILKSFFLEQELDEFVVELFFAELQKPGLILLPSGNTFEENIYPKLDAMFASLEFQTFNADTHDTKKTELNRLVDPGLRLSHLDELIPDIDYADKHIFANAIKKSLPNIISQLKEKFYEIDIVNPNDFKNYLRSFKPRIIFAGLGSDPVHAHFAFIGEEYINSEITRVSLSQSVQELHGCKSAISIGTDVLKSPSLEKIYVVVKGAAKAAALKAAFEDDTTGLGYVIANHADKLCILVDNSVLS